jgi:hypothetical protein
MALPGVVAERGRLVAPRFLFVAIVEILGPKRLQRADRHVGEDGELPAALPRC